MSLITGLQVLGTDIASILNYWADIGVFAYVLPFLLIFAVVYGILSKINIFGEAGQNKGVNAVIGIAVGLLSLQWDYVPNFFARIFPFAGMGISILLVALILMGLFGDWNDAKYKNIFLSIGAVIAVIVVISALTNVGWQGGYWWDQYGPALITLIILGVLVAMVIGGKKATS